MATPSTTELDILQGKNPISRLQEVCQQRKFPIPVYKECQGTYQMFGTEVTVTLEEITKCFRGLGRTKKAGKTNAAMDALNFIAVSKPHLLEPPQQPEVDESLLAEIQVKAVQANRQRVDVIDQRVLAKETEELSHIRVDHDLSRLIQQSRTKAGLSQKELATRMNEKPIVVVDYESGRAIPSNQILAKMERALGVHLRGEKAGQAKIIGRGARRRAQ